MSQTVDRLAEQRALDEHYMRLALLLADEAEKLGEVPVGAILVRENQIIGQGFNQPIGTHDPSAHAEIQALRSAGAFEQNYRLPGASLYVTLEPCLMCAGAIFQARLSRVVFGAKEPKTGVAGSTLNLFDNAQLNHHTQCEGGVLEIFCAEKLSSFFAKRRLLRRNNLLAQEE